MKTLKHLTNSLLPTGIKRLAPAFSLFAGFSFFLIGELFEAAAVYAADELPPVVVKCNCPDKQTVNEALANSSLAFVGIVEKVENHPLKSGEVEVEFTVHHRFKGFDEVRTERVLIYTSRDETCGYQFRQGLDYLVFARGTAAHFFTDICSGTDILENSMTDVERLKRLTGNDPSNKIPDPLTP